MGYFPIGWEEIVKTLGLTAILFLGPLFEAGIVDGEWKDWIKLKGLNAVISGWIGWRNFVAVRPSSCPTLFGNHKLICYIRDR
jgi:prenyl protein peptidase